jgi:dihydrolipoamide dehydrogenase
MEVDMADKYDVLVIGGGPGGYSTAISAAKSGLKVALFEKENLGGTCLNVGCIPTKYLVDKAGTMEKIRNLTANGVFRGAGFFSFKKIQAEKAKVVSKLTGGVGALLKGTGVTVVKGEATLKKNCTVSCGGTDYKGKNVIIATGSEPVLIPIPGAEKTINSTQALALEKVPAKFAVIGGGVIGLELASAFASFGSEVTVIEMLNELCPNEEPRAVKQLRTALKKHGLNILTGAKVLSVNDETKGLSVSYDQDGKTGKVMADKVLMAIGRKPVLTGIDAAALGLEMAPRNFIKVNEYQQTNLPGVYAIGDVAGGFQLAHAAYAEGETALAAIQGEKKPLDVSVMPRCIYTIPCFAAVGLTTAQAEKAGIQTVTGVFNYEGNGMALAEGATGSVYAIMNKETKETLGFQIVGENSSEMIAAAAEAVKKHKKLEEWETTVVAHPSLAEMLKEAVLDAFGKAVHKM